MGMDAVSTPSISLEGKNLWLLKTMPVEPVRILRAKVQLHMLVNVPSAVLSLVLLCVAMRIDWLAALAMVPAVCVFIWLTGLLGLIIGLKRPNLNWTSEQVVIKQSLNILFIMLIGMAITVILAGGGWHLRQFMSPTVWMLVFSAVAGVICVLLTRWLGRGGTECFIKL